MIAIITGSKGFVGPYLKKELEDNDYEVHGIGLEQNDNDNNYHECDMRDSKKISELIEQIKPDYVFHLAGFSSVAKSFENPKLCFEINVNGTKNLLEAIIKAGIKPKTLIVSSSEIYGKPKYNPIDESHPINPISPYGTSKVAQENICKKYDLPITIARSFNHTGPNQQETFVIPSFKKQVKEAKSGEKIFVGNLNVTRDFSDVRDVVKTYRILLEKNTAGEIYNVGSGNEYLLKDVLNKIILESGKKLIVEIDPAKYRKADIEKQICNPKKILEIIDFKFRKII